MLRKNQKYIPFLLFIISIFCVIFIQFGRLDDQYQIEEDFRSFYWMNRFLDPDLYPNDQLRSNKYSLIDILGVEIPLYHDSPGYSLLFYFASFVMSPVLFSKVLPFFLLPVTVLYLYAFGRDFRDANTGFILAIGFILTNLASPGSQSIILGLQRSFGPSLVLILIYYLYKENYGAAAVTLVLSALIFAPVFVLGAVTWALHLVWFRWGRNLWQEMKNRGLVYLAAAVVLGFILLIPSILDRLDNSLSISSILGVEESGGDHNIQSQRLWEKPQYSSGGRSELFVVFPLIGRGGFFDDPLEAFNFLILFTLSGINILLVGKRSFFIPSIVWLLLLASLIMFMASWIAIWITNSFLLYLPSRYTRVGFVICALVFLAFNLQYFLDSVVSLLRNNRKRLVWHILFIELILFGYIFFYAKDRFLPDNLNLLWVLLGLGIILAGLTIYYSRKSPVVNNNFPDKKHNIFGWIILINLTVLTSAAWLTYVRTITNSTYLNPQRTERELLQYIETLPKDVLIGGHPCLLDNIPLLAKRQILFSCEQISSDSELTVKTLDAYFAKESSTVQNYCQTYQIDYLVIDPFLYTDEFLENEWIFYEPYNQQVLPLVQSRKDFCLEKIPDEMKVFKNDKYFVVACDGLMVVE